VVFQPQFEPSPLCPSCARREQSTAVGLCDVCTVERVAANYAAQDGSSAQVRTIAWAERTAHETRPDARSATLRQQRSRLLRRMRPREPMPGVDPLVIGAEALALLARMRHALQRLPEERRRLEEIVRRLSCGPGD
jgi:hypothetical protein